jgi:hypothetical protein
MDAVELVDKLINENKELRLEIEHLHRKRDARDRERALELDLIDYAREQIWQRYGEHKYYDDPIHFENGEPESFYDWFNRSYHEFPRFMSADKFRSDFTIKLRKRYNSKVAEGEADGKPE